MSEADRIRLRRSHAVHKTGSTTTEGNVDLIWIILIVILVLALLGFFGRGRWY